MKELNPSETKSRYQVSSDNYGTENEGTFPRLAPPLDVTKGLSCGVFNGSSSSC